MIIQTAPPGAPHLAIMMHEHTALAGQFARAFGNTRFEPAEPADLVAYIVSHHDAGWAEFDRNPVVDPKTSRPYNLIETPAEHITVTSRASPDFNERQHPYCGLLSSMHSWGLYNGRYGLSDLVLIEKFPPAERPIAERMLAGELKRQERLKGELAKSVDTAAWIAHDHLFQNYKQLQFFDTLALYFNRIHPNERTAQDFAHVPVDARQDVTVTIRPRGGSVYALSPYPFAADNAEFAFAGRLIAPPAPPGASGWGKLLRELPTQWESFRLVAG
jgi:hypothetical protein